MNAYLYLSQFLPHLSDLQSTYLPPSKLTYIYPNFYLIYHIYSRPIYHHECLLISIPISTSSIKSTVDLSTTMNDYLHLSQFLSHLSDLQSTQQPPRMLTYIYP